MISQRSRATLWQAGVTTVPQRLNDLLPRTLASLRVGGFDGECSPRLFVDGLLGSGTAEYETRFGLEITTRWPRLRSYGNWILALAEMYIRNPAAERYALFQDDVIASKNLRRYLEKCKYPEKGYWNLYAAPSSETALPSKDYRGWYLAPHNLGKGALGLVFSQECVRLLLSHQHMVDRVMDTHRGWRSIDGAVVQCLNKLGWSEWCHRPSLVQHIGPNSTMGTKPQPLAPSFLGEDFDLLTLT